MKKVKIVLWAGAALVLVFITVCATLLLAVDPSKYKDRVVATVERSLQRPLNVSGDVGWTFFPWLGIELGAVQIGNPEGFDDKPFATIQSAVLRVSAASLLRGRIEAGTIAVQGLDLHLVRKADGSDNWSDLKQEAASSEPKQSSGQKNKSITVHAVDFSAARIVWDDQQTSQKWVLTNGEAHVSDFAAGDEAAFRFSADARGPGEQALNFTYEGRAQVAQDFTAFQFTGNKLTADVILQDRAVNGVKTSFYFDGAIDLNVGKMAFPALTWNVETVQGKIPYRISGGGGADVFVELNKQMMSFERLRGDLRVNGEVLPGFGIPLAISGDGAVKLSEQVATLYGMKLELGDAAITGQVKVNFGEKQPRALVEFNLVPINLRKALVEYGFLPPNTRDEHTFSHLAAQASVSWKPGQFDARGINLQIDKSKLVGDAQWNYTPVSALHFNLALNGVDADLYRSPPTPATPTNTQQTQTTSAQQPSPLANWSVNGLFKCGACKGAGLVLRDVDVVVSSDRVGHLLVEPKMSLYDGRAVGRLDLDFVTSPAELDLESQLTGVDVGALLVDFRGSTPVTGHGDITLSLAGQGLAWETLASSFQGDGSAILRDGAVKGVNIAYEVRKARAKLRGEALDTDKSRDTDFAELTTQFVVADGVVKHSSIDGKSPLMRVEGEGEAHLVKQKLDYRLDVAFVNTLKGQGGRELGDLANVAVPIKIDGSFADPKVKVDAKRLAKAAVESEAAAPIIDKAKEKAKDIEKKLDKKLKDLFN